MKQLTEKELKKIYNGNVIAIPSNPFPLFVRFPQEVRYLIFDSLNMYSRMGKAREVSLEGLPKGTYFISWKSNEKNITLKFKKR